jgi:hypothetical protein
MDKKDNEIAHIGIVSRMANATNVAQINNSPCTGSNLKSYALGINLTRACRFRVENLSASLDVEPGKFPGMDFVGFTALQFRFCALTKLTKNHQASTF